MMETVVKTRPKTLMMTVTELQMVEILVQQAQRLGHQTLQQTLMAMAVKILLKILMMTATE